MAATRTFWQSGTPWEPKVGYARVVRVGQQVFVSGTTATDADGNLVGTGDMAAQARQVFDNIERALGKVGAGLRDVVRSRIYVTDIAQWQAAGLEHGRRFKDILPAATLVEVKGLVHPDMLIEVEVDAVVAT